MKTAEKIYSSSTNEETADARLAERLAHMIEDDIVSNNVPTGGVMGSLREMSERYAVGRAAMREAVALLERRGLGRLRPGPCGGFIVARPDLETISGEVSNYFRMTGIRLGHLLDAREAVDLMAAGLAAASQPRANADGICVEPASHESALQWHLRLREEVARATRDPVLRLFVAVLNALTVEFVKHEAPDNAWRAPAADLARRLETAIRARDAESASTVAEELHRELRVWLRHEDGPLSLPTIDSTRHEDDRTLATLVARKLAAEILENASAGHRLGSEWDFCERFSVSRATLRQAIRQLQDSGLVECRRGRGNGLVVRDLRGTGSIRLVLAYLISHKMDPTAAGTILFQLNRFVPALAVARASPKQRAMLASLLQQASARDPIDRFELLRLVQHVSLAADSPIIDMFSRCLAAYEARFHPFLAERLPATFQATYFDLLRHLLAETDTETSLTLGRAKRESAAVMVDMSHDRPI